ncbi:DUF2207 domain-containing protein [uncultured Sphingomonas sp.]|uniref:DUF2207 domain-containing protein n=1 Tax=uncultured Sphingomonas sp. TaxID=158754 RepID=UPI0035CB0189
MRRRLARLIALALACIVLPVLAQDDRAAIPVVGIASDSTADQGQERILSFLSDVRIKKSGALDVTETIRFLVTGDAIRHGINREFPTRYRTPLGRTTTVAFTMVSAARDGAAEQYSLTYLSNGVRMQIGKPDVIVPPGEHVYVIRYRTSRQVIRGSDRDELYWNATGNGWRFAIDSAEARITLPTPAAFGDRAAYTGPQGSTAADAMVVDERPGYIAFRTTRPLPIAAGLTVAAAFPPTAIDPVTANRRLGWWLQDWAGLAASLLSIVGMGIYYFRAWLGAGRGPRPGPVVPIFSPPAGLSAAAARYINRMKLDNRGFTAAVVQLGVLGQLHIRKEDGGWFHKGTTTLDRTMRDVTVPAAEGAMLSTLFGGGDTLALKQDNHATLQAARTALEKQLKQQYAATMFSANTDWATYGVLTLIGCMLAIAFVSMAVRDPVAAPQELGIPVMGAAFLAGAVWLHRVARRSTGSQCLLWAGIVIAAMFAALFCVAAVLDALAGGEVAVLFPLVIIPLAISAFIWMAAPTAEGRRAMDQIAGFKQYLGIAEEQRLDRMNPPEKTPELFEQYLPYAIALDVENRWAARFTGVLAAAAAAGTTANSMMWYSGNGNFWSDPGSFASEVGGSLNSAISSAATSPSSSDGGLGGGGSSGGGGGGGGGSGW